MNKGGAGAGLGGAGGGGGSGPTAAAAAAAAQKQKTLLQRVDNDIRTIVDNFSGLVNVCRVPLSLSLPLTHTYIHREAHTTGKPQMIRTLNGRQQGPIHCPYA